MLVYATDNNTGAIIVQYQQVPDSTILPNAGDFVIEEGRKYKVIRRVFEQIFLKREYKVLIALESVQQTKR